MKTESIVPVEQAINWYWGNYIMSPTNALRDNETLLDEAFREMDAIKKELKEKKLTHLQALSFMKECGIHAKYYRHRKHALPYCSACDKLGVPSFRL